MPWPTSDADAYTYEDPDYLWRFPTLRFLLALHQRIIDTSGGTHGVRDAGLIDSAAHAPLTSIAATDDGPTLFDEVAALGYSLAMNHGFIDGNKRTAYAAMYQALAWGGQTLAWEPQTAATVMSLLGAGHLTRDGLRHAVALGCRD